MRLAIPAAAAATAATVATLAIAVPAHAGVAPSDLKAKKIVATVKDRSGDVTAVAGTLTYDGSGLHEGPGTKTTPTAADKAIDLHKVVYTIVRVGKSPVLRIEYDVKGPLSSSESASSYSFDGVETGVGHGYSVISVNDANVAGVVPTGLVDKKGHTHACAGLHYAQPSKHVATQTVPLSCLTRAGIKSAALSSGSLHGTATQTSQSTGTYTLATDGSGTTRTLPLTRYKK